MTELDDLRRENEALRRRNEQLARSADDATQALDAFTRGEVDAVALGQGGTPVLLRAAHDELRDNRQLLRAIFDSAVDAIMLADDAGIYVDVNPAACKLFALPRDQLLGRSFADFTLPGTDGRDGFPRVPRARPYGRRVPDPAAGRDDCDPRSQCGRQRRARPAFIDDREELRDDLAASRSEISRSDQALVTRVLQLGRSAMYASFKPGDLESTISRIGFQSVHTLAETVWLHGCFEARDRRFAADTERLARFGLARAVAMRALAWPTKLSGTSAYFAGLLADVGASFLLCVIAEKSLAANPESCLAFVRQHTPRSARSS